MKHKYNIGDIVFVNQGRRNGFYRPLNDIAVIIEVYDTLGVDGYRIIMVGNKETFFVQDKYIQEKLGEI